MRLTKVEEIPQQNGDFDDLEAMITDEGTVFEILKQILHGKNIGLKLEPDSFKYPMIMTVGLDNLWVNPEREFLGAQDYTVVGRVTQMVSGKISGILSTSSR